MEPRTVEYYINKSATSGENTLDPEQFKTKQGVLHGFGHRITHLNGQPMQITDAIIEDPETHEFRYIEYNRVVKFVD